MGIFSKYHRFREQGEEANVNNVSRFGQPVRSLFTSTKIFTIHHHIDITDENGNLAYQARSKAISIKDKTNISDASGNHVAYIERQVFTIHEKHHVTMANGTSFTLSTEILHIYNDVINIEGLGWQLRGNLFELNFEIYDQNGAVIAVIGQKMLSIHDKYCIDIYRPELEPMVIAILIALQHMIIDRENSRSASWSSSGN